MSLLFVTPSKGKWKEKSRRGIFIKQHSILKLLFGLLLFFLTAACTDNDPEITMLEAVEKSREEIADLAEVDRAATSFDGESFIQFRLMTEEVPTEEKAETLFNIVIDTIEENSQRPDVWESYDGVFDIRTYEDGIVYEAAHSSSGELNIESRQ